MLWCTEFAFWDLHRHAPRVCATGHLISSARQVSHDQRWHSMSQRHLSSVSQLSLSTTSITHILRHVCAMGWDGHHMQPHCMTQGTLPIAPADISWHKADAISNPTRAGPSPGRSPWPWDPTEQISPVDPGNSGSSTSTSHIPQRRSHSWKLIFTGRSQRPCS